MNPSALYSNFVEVDLGAIENNIRLIAERSRTQVMAVVKANAYGHGAVPVAQAALNAGASWCGVARLDEALLLRQAGLDCPVLVLGYTPPGRFEQAIAQRVSLVVWSREQVQQVSSAARKMGQKARVHLKVDTGMSRLGVQLQEALELARALASAEGVQFEGVFTHFARADELEPAPTDRQEALFQEVLRQLHTEGLKPAYVHAYNSAASLTRPATYTNLVRTGIAIYGLDPSDECSLPPSFRPALSWKAVLSQVKMLPSGRGLSYGHEYTTRATERIGTVPVGYADGMRRITGKNQVLVGGQRVPVVGRVCMDQILVQLDGVPQAKMGDEVVLIGSQGEERISAEEIAVRWGTNNYEVVCGIQSRVPRLYYGERAQRNPTTPSARSG